MRLAHISRRFVASTIALVLGASSLAASAQPWHEPGREGDQRGHAQQRGHSQRGTGHQGHGGHEGHASHSGHGGHGGSNDRRGERNHGAGQSRHDSGPTRGGEGRGYQGGQGPQVSIHVHPQTGGGEMRPARGAGPEHRYHRGDRLPPEARRQVMVVQDWRNHRLDPPPRGHDWVRLGTDFVLVAAATGIIAQVILSTGR